MKIKNGKLVINKERALKAACLGGALVMGGIPAGIAVAGTWIASGKMMNTIMKGFGCSDDELVKLW